MILSKSTVYGIRALAYLAKQNHGFCSIQEIAQELRIPTDFLGKIMAQLRRCRLVESVKGLHGGYKLHSEPRSITLLDVFQVLEPSPYMDLCILGTGICNEEKPCSIHCSWLEVKNQIVGFLQRTNVSQVVERECMPPAQISE